MSAGILRRISAGLVLLGLVACEQGLSESDIREAIDVALADEWACLDDLGVRFPDTIHPQNPYSGAVVTRDRDPLVAVGLLTATDAVRMEPEYPPSFHMGAGSVPMLEVPIRIYTLTAEGKRAYRTSQTASGSTTARFCYGRPVVEEVVRYTEPAEAMGETVSSVMYTEQLTDVPEWARDPRITAVDPDVARRIQPRQRAASLILTNKGWYASVAPDPPRRPLWMRGR